MWLAPSTRPPPSHTLLPPSLLARSAHTHSVSQVMMRKPKEKTAWPRRVWAFAGEGAEDKALMSRAEFFEQYHFDLAGEAAEWPLWSRHILQLAIEDNPYKCVRSSRPASFRTSSLIARNAARASTSSKPTPSTSPTLRSPAKRTGCGS